MHKKESTMTTILTDHGEVTVAATNGLCLSPTDTQRATQWTLKPEGLCRDELCVPLQPHLRHGDRIDVAAFWRLLGNPVLSDDTSQTWVLGTGPTDREAALAGTTAPDFALPDLAGTPHRLSDLRGQKIFLTTWASW
jgi:hypothetical protein